MGDDNSSATSDAAPPGDAVMGPPDPAATPASELPICPTISDRYRLEVDLSEFASALPESTFELRSGEFFRRCDVAHNPAHVASPLYIAYNDETCPSMTMGPSVGFGGSSLVIGAIRPFEEMELELKDSGGATFAAAQFVPDYVPMADGLEDNFPGCPPRLYVAEFRLTRLRVP